MVSIGSATPRESRLVGARAVVRILTNMARYRGFEFDEITWLTDPSEESALGSYTLLVTAGETRKDMAFLQQELEALDKDPRQMRRVGKSLNWLVDEMAA